MPDIFISYKYEERNVAALLAERLTEAGFDVWWDSAVLAGERFEDEIRSMLAASRVAIVLWSKAAVTSDWVKAEAEIARKRGIVLPAFIDDVEVDRIPLLFQPMHTADLRRWAGDRNHPGLKEVIEALRRRIGEPAGPVLTEEQAEQRLAAGASEAEVWAAITDSPDQSADEYRRYVERYGKGARFAELADLRIKRLEQGERQKRWNWAHFGTLIAGLGALIGSLVALAQFVQANPGFLGVFGPEWGITAEQREAAARCDTWTRSGRIHPISDLPMLEGTTVADCETAYEAYASTGDYIGHLTLARLAQGPSQGAASVKLAAEGVGKKQALAIYAQAIMYEEGYELYGNLQRAAELYKEAADLGLVQAKARLCGMFVENVAGWTLDVGDPAAYCREAADAGSAVAQHLFGFVYESGSLGRQVNLSQAAELYAESAAQGNSVGQRRLGTLYRDGRGVVRDNDRAIELFKDAADQQDPAAKRLLGMMYELGTGLERDYVQAGALYEAAAQGDDTIAWQLLAYDVNPGGWARNFPESFEIGQLAMNTSSPIGQRLVSYDYYWGVNGPPNHSLAFEGYESVANTGNPFGEFILGFFYERGYGVEANVAKALELYQRAADQGELHGQEALASMYENGTGVSRDVQTAIRYYRLAAAQGSRFASERLAALANQPGQ